MEAQSLLYAEVEVQELKHLVDNVDELDLDGYGDVVRYNCRLFSSGIWVETFRQWFIIVVTIGFIVLFSISLRNLRRTQGGLDFDQGVLIAELVKVSKLSRQRHSPFNLILNL